ncbi:hypothetical protein RSAG8_08450, partial [Rhizoctonia solani AG-8 WAC10335]
MPKSWADFSARCRYDERSRFWPSRVITAKISASDIIVWRPRSMLTRRSGSIFLLITTCHTTLYPFGSLGSLYNFVGAEPSFSGFLSHQGVMKTTVALWSARAIRSHFGWQVLDQTQNIYVSRPA